MSRSGSEVLLADLRRNAEQHVLHDLAADRAGLSELVEAFRTATPAADALRALVPTAAGRNYSVLVGLRRSVGWAALRSHALESALHALCAAFRVVVCDIDADLEGEADGGSIDVEERNAPSRTAVAQAAVVVVVGAPGIKGTHSLLRVLGEVWSHGATPSRTVAVLNRGDAAASGRLTRALAHLGGSGATVVHLNEAAVEQSLLNGSLLPTDFVQPLIEAVEPLLASGNDSTGDLNRQAAVRIEPGTLGVLTED